MKDLCVNIPVMEILHITNTSLKQNNSDTLVPQQILMLLSLVLNQNYFECDKKCYKPNQGVAMGSPVSGIITEIFLQYYEHPILKHILEMNAVIYYNCYIYDVFIVFNSTTITEEVIMNIMNTIHSNLQFFLTLKDNNYKIT
jgi:hypothetical protein